MKKEATFSVVVRRGRFSSSYVDGFSEIFFSAQKVVQHGAWHPYFFSRWDALQSIQKQTDFTLMSRLDLKHEISSLMSAYSMQSEMLYSGR